MSINNLSQLVSPSPRRRDFAPWFWSSVELTGNQTVLLEQRLLEEFWSSVELTGNQTHHVLKRREQTFWSSVELTGNQTRMEHAPSACGFGAVSN